MPKKIRLSLEVETDLDTVGISSALKDYKLAFNINANLNTKLKRIEDFVFRPEKSNTELGFSLFHEYLSDANTSICLLQNRQVEGYLMSVFRQADYFLILQNPINENIISQYISSLKTIPKVNAAFQLKLSGAKSYASFAQDLELHLMEYSKKP